MQKGKKEIHTKHGFGGFETKQEILGDCNGNGSENITLFEDDNIIADNTEIAKTFNKFFDEAVEATGYNWYNFLHSGYDNSNKLLRFGDKFLEENFWVLQLIMN